MAVIAFIGLGNMGSGMAVNLVKAGHEVRGFDLNQDAVAVFSGQGGKAASSVLEAVSGADAVVTMLPAGKHVRGIYEGEEGIIAHVKPDAILMDCSTIDVDSARAVGGVAAKAGIKFVDAPVSGGVAAAEGGTLTFMVGGPEEAFEAAKPFLEKMGKAVIRAGDSGAGQAAKICNNMLLGIHMIGTCEAFALAQKLGLDPQRFFDISSKASGQNWSMTSYCPVPGPVPAAPSNRGYKPGFAAPMMLKDLRLALETAQSANAAIPLGAHAEKLYTLFTESGGNEKDFSGIIEMIAANRTE
ncbi:3-hydroxyisobutyrate dehydrogenase [Glycocaulis alkaliphilus]|uniref:3-hydroxyisobutyrate dehydrogenase n=1 Tax=Glycocaulis alkaliphilus TaxID=1434191 RepID=A0A3T0E9U6_9PROT|nr:3-hydroxyisobutyrate dehydrogenase [Glycocaulis alkaliphilus]AZU04203.1 3-hydroxyisobutyrate dehydrogenase [Glycocaulis alkaliphilus]GGB76645.1 3-hydroxyisobutyrate dehydrogenase [Glycocaulis alkaliphilus]